MTNVILNTNIFFYTREVITLKSDVFCSCCKGTGEINTESNDLCFLTDRSYPCPFCRYNYLDYCIALFSPRMFDRINTIFSVFTSKYSVDFHVIQNLQMLIRKLSSEDNIGRKMLRRKHSSIRTSQRRSAPVPQ